MVSKSLQERKCCFEVGGIRGYAVTTVRNSKCRSLEEEFEYIFVLLWTGGYKIRDHECWYSTWICALPLRSACVSLSTVVGAEYLLLNLTDSKGADIDMLCR